MTVRTYSIKYVEELQEEMEFWKASSEEADGMMKEAEAKIERLRAALESIANNTCCDPCQEAKLVAKAALEQDHE